MATYNKEDLFSHLELIKPNGFNWLPDLPIFQRVEEDRTLEITMSIREYYPHSAVIRGCLVGISFFKVEEVLNEVKRNNIFPEKHEQIRQNTIGKSLSGISGVDYTFLDNHNVEDDISFNLVKPQLQLLVSAAEQFFIDFSNVEDVFNYTETMNLSQLANFIGQPVSFRRMIIKKIVDDPQYETYAQQVIDYQVTKNDMVKEQFAKALKDKLEELYP